MAGLRSTSPDLIAFTTPALAGDNGFRFRVKAVDVCREKPVNGRTIDIFLINKKSEPKVNRNPCKLSLIIVI